MFVPLAHPPGHAQADFGEADVIIAGIKRRAHFFVMTCQRRSKNPPLAGVKVHHPGGVKLVHLM